MVVSKMECNICGGIIPDGENTCKYCGNIMILPKKKEEIQKAREIQPSLRRNPTVNVPLDATVEQQRKPQGLYCKKCGRPLDGVTHKCIVCDAAQVSKRVYNNDDFKNREMDIMAQKKKKKKKNNTVRNVIIAILLLIILFSVAVSLASEFSSLLGIGPKEEKKDFPIATEAPTKQPKKTPDPNWKPENGDPTPLPTVEPTRAPVRTPVPSEQGDPVETRGGEYEYPTHKQVISKDKLVELGKEKAEIIYWEIYARHGYSFDLDNEKESNFAYYFEEKQWYQPDISDKAKVEAEFNSFEKENIKIIDPYIKQR